MALPGKVVVAMRIMVNMAVAAPEVGEFAHWRATEGTAHASLSGRWR